MIRINYCPKPGQIPTYGVNGVRRSRGWGLINHKLCLLRTHVIHGALLGSIHTAQQQTLGKGSPHIGALTDRQMFPYVSCCLISFSHCSLVSCTTRVANSCKTVQFELLLVNSALKSAGSSEKAFGLQSVLRPAPVQGEGNIHTPQKKKTNKKLLLSLCS